MAAIARYSPPDGVDTMSQALDALSELAARLAADEPLDDRLERTLGGIRTLFGADEVALWLEGSRGLTRAWSAGAGAATPDEVMAVLAVEGEAPSGIAARWLVAGRRRLGALVVIGTRTLSRDEYALLTTAANLFAPALAHAEYSHQLEVEVALRTRQIDDERRFTERIIDSLPVGLYVIDRQYRIQAWNRKRETGMQGVSREEAIGRTIFEILHRQPAESLRREFDEVFRSGQMQMFYMESRASGEARTYRISKIPMRLNDAAVTHVIAIGEDVTEWKEAQERFAQAEKLAAIGQLAAGIMHEINNPLATIAACAESLVLRLEDMGGVGAVPPPDSMEFLKIIDGEVHRCKRIVDGLLDFSRPKPVTKDSTDVNSVIEQTLFLVKHHTRFKKVRVETNLDHSLERVHANPEQLVQVFMALLLNAGDAMDDAGTITIRTRRGRRDARVVAEVIDEGHGIPRSETSKIFEPFYTTKAPGRGTGLGLSICYGIIADHGGRIEVDSVPGQGSTFRILLPSEADRR